MKNIPLIIFLVILSFFACSKSGKKVTDDLRRFYLHGNIKSVRATSFQAKDSFGTIIKIPNSVDEGYFMFNNNGNIVEEISYKNDGSIESKVTTQFDENGNQKEKITYNADGSVSILSKYLLTKSGKIEEEKVYDNDGNLTNKLVYSYDSKDNLQEILYYSKGELNINGSIKYKYDEKGNKIEELWSFMSLKMYAKKNYKYDKKGLVVEQNNYTNNDSLETRITYKYEFDKKGNWIQQIENDNGFPTKITELKIEYFK